MRVRHCFVKIALVILMGIATYYTLICPCDRVGKCHLPHILGSLSAAIVILGVENLIPGEQ